MICWRGTAAFLRVTRFDIINDVINGVTCTDVYLTTSKLQLLEAVTFYLNFFQRRFNLAKLLCREFLSCFSNAEIHRNARAVVFRAGKNASMKNCSIELMRLCSVRNNAVLT